MVGGEDDDGVVPASYVVHRTQDQAEALITQLVEFDVVVKLS